MKNVVHSCTDKHAAVFFVHTVTVIIRDVMQTNSRRGLLKRRAVSHDATAPRRRCGRVEQASCRGWAASTSVQPTHMQRQPAAPSFHPALRPVPVFGGRPQITSIRARDRTPDPTASDATQTAETDCILTVKGATATDPCSAVDRPAASIRWRHNSIIVQRAEAAC